MGNNENRGKSVSFVNMKGGVGKSSKKKKNENDKLSIWLKGLKNDK